MSIIQWFETIGAFIAVITPFLLGVIAIWRKQKKDGGTTREKVKETLEEVKKLGQGLQKLQDKNKKNKK